MKACNHDFKTLHLEDALSDVVKQIMAQDEHTIAEVVHLKQHRPDGFISRNRRREAHNPSEN